MTANNNWAGRLEQVRRGFEWSYAQLGQVFGVSASTAYYWSTGQTPVPASVRGHIVMLERVLEEQQQETQQQLAQQLLAVGITALGAWAIGKIFGSNGEEDKTA